MVRRLPCLWLLPIALNVAHGQWIERIIPNGLNETWPLEHIYFDFNPSEVTGPMTCTSRQ
jgi:hypothetical protein